MITAHATVIPTYIQNINFWVDTRRSFLVFSSSLIIMGWFKSARCTSLARLDGKTAVITGANTGIGKYTAEDFFLRGARVIMACRNLEKAKQAAEDIKEQHKNTENTGEILTTELNLSDLQSVRKCAKYLSDSETKINLLINNAGMICPKSTTVDGFEMQFGTNYLGHFLLTILLLPKLRNSAPARIVNVSSDAYFGSRMDFSDLNFEKKKYSQRSAYQQSKLANILFTKELAKRLKENNIEDVTVYVLHPGVIKTDMAKTFMSNIWGGNLIYNYWSLKTPEEGAQTTIYCAVDEKCAKESGLYYGECAPKCTYRSANNVEDAKKLWELSFKLTGFEENFDPFK